MSAYQDLDRFQEEQRIWAEKNFGHTVAHPSKPLRGVVEEVGELQEAQDAAIAQVITEQVALNKVWGAVARLCHFDLKGEQGIRYTPEEVIAKKRDAIGDLFIYAVDYCTTSGFSMGEALDEAWTEVKKRDWVADPINAADVARKS
jgi:NTP pyrophosphatase (non-canonical NTP hydrolase)